MPNAWWGRTLHQSCVASTIESVSASSPTKSAYSLQPPNGSWTPQRGKVRVKISRADGVKARLAAVEERRVRRRGEEHGQHLAHPVGDGDRAVGAADTDVDVEAPGVVALDDPAQLVAQPVVVLGVDDPLVEVVRPGMRPGRGERRVVLGRQREQPAAAVALALGRVGEGLTAPGPDLDLGVDQLAADRRGELVVGLGGVVQLLEAVLELERLRIEDRELLLDPDR